MLGSKRSDLEAGEVTRHRLLEGILLRLGRLPDDDRFVLRGGMLLRHWFRPLARPAADLDLVSTFPFSVEETARQFIPLLAERRIDDGVTFDTQRFRVEGIWLETDYPGVRVFASGAVECIEDDFRVDVTFGEPLIPKPELAEYRAEYSGHTAYLWMCRPETIIGRKLHALMHMGMMHWRPKDLNDLRLLLFRVPISQADLPEAIAASFTSRGNSTADARNLFHESWWTLKMTAARWQDFVEESAGQDVPRNLSRVVADVSARLQPILERLP